jgi:hypothetical protein
MMSEDDWKTFKIRFGKHAGETMYTIFINDYQYIEWLDNTMLDQYTRKAVDSAIEYHYKNLMQ